MHQNVQNKIRNPIIVICPTFNEAQIISHDIFIITTVIFYRHRSRVPAGPTKWRIKIEPQESLQMRSYDRS